MATQRNAADSKFFDVSERTVAELHTRFTTARLTMATGYGFLIAFAIAGLAHFGASTVVTITVLVVLVPLAVFLTMLVWRAMLTAEAQQIEARRRYEARRAEADPGPTLK